MSKVAVPNLIGKDRGVAESMLDGLLLRHIAKFPFGGSLDIVATEQSPIGGTVVEQYSIVTVTYPNVWGLPDSPVEGPTLSGEFRGKITSVKVHERGATIDFLKAHKITDPPPTIPISGGYIVDSFSLALYYDDLGKPVPTLPRTEWMRRGAMLSLAQRAFTNAHSVNLVVADSFVRSIEILKP